MTSATLTCRPTPSRVKGQAHHLASRVVGAGYDALELAGLLVAVLLLLAADLVGRGRRRTV